MSDDEDVCISVNGQSVQILCGLCRKPIAFVGEVDAEAGNAGCVACENVANVNEIVDIVSHYVKDEGQVKLNRMAADVARKSKIMTFKGQLMNNESYRFIVDFEL